MTSRGGGQASLDGTLKGLERQPGGWARTWGSRLMLTLVLVIVLAGGTGQLGVRTESVSAGQGGYRLSLEYPRVARAGLDVTWKATITHAGGFGKTLTLAVTSEYFGMYEEQGFYPEPDSATRTASQLLLTFAAPPGDTFVVSFDAYVQPASQRGRSGELSLLVAGSPVASVQFSTVVSP